MNAAVNLRDFQVIRGDGRRGRIMKLPDDVVRVDRLTRWGNPYRVGDPHPLEGWPMDREEVIGAYRGWLDDRLRLYPDFLDPLRGKRLACWCAPLSPVTPTSSWNFWSR